MALVLRIDAGSVAPFRRAALPKESDHALQAQMLAALGQVGTQAQAARDKTKEKLAAMNWREQLVAWGGPAGRALFLVLHLGALESHLRTASPFWRLTLGATAAAFGLARF